MGDGLGRRGRALSTRGLVVSGGACALVRRADMDMIFRLVHAYLRFGVQCAEAWWCLCACARSCPLACPSLYVRVCECA